MWYWINSNGAEQVDFTHEFSLKSQPIVELKNGVEQPLITGFERMLKSQRKVCKSIDQ
jgi:hypothetical protein